MLGLGLKIRKVFFIVRVLYKSMFDIYLYQNAKKKNCTKYREDGAVIEAGENDTLIVQKLILTLKLIHPRDEAF